MEFSSRIELERRDGVVSKHPKLQYKTEFQSHEPEVCPLACGLLFISAFECVDMLLLLVVVHTWGSFDSAFLLIV